jgi:hypothetical protein
MEDLKDESEKYSKAKYFDAKKIQTTGSIDLPCLILFFQCLFS